LENKNFYDKVLIPKQKPKKWRCLLSALIVKTFKGKEGNTIGKVVGSLGKGNLKRYRGKIVLFYFIVPKPGRRVVVSDYDVKQTIIFTSQELFPSPKKFCRKARRNVHRR
jgi:hypothetical protein